MPLAARLLALILAATALLAFVVRLRAFMFFGPFALGWRVVEWRAVGLAVASLILLLVTKRRSQEGVVWTRLAAAVACAVLSGTLLVGFAPPVWRELVYLDVRTGGRLSIAAPNDYTRSDVGPWVLPYLDVERLLEDRLDAAFTWMALRRHGWSADAIVAEPRQGRRLLLGVLREEADPPRWWNEEWSSRVAALPRGSFRMGLLSEDVARAGLRVAARDVRSLQHGEHETLVALVGLHPGLLTAAEAEAVLLAWRERWLLMGRPFEAVLAARRSLAALLGTGGGRVVGLRVEAATPAEASLVPSVEAAVRHLLGTLGHKAVRGDDLRIVFAVQEREYRRIRRDHSVLVTQGVTARVRMETQVRWVGRFWMPLRRSVPVTEYEPVFGRETLSFQGVLHAPVLVLRVIARGRERTVEAPPLGFIYCEGPDGVACEPSWSEPNQVFEASREAERMRYGLPGRLEFLLASWLWGLPPAALGIGLAGSQHHEPVSR